jgi:hypothetical protein
MPLVGVAAANTATAFASWVGDSAVTCPLLSVGQETATAGRPGSSVCVYPGTVPTGGTPLMSQSEGSASGRGSGRAPAGTPVGPGAARPPRSPR